MRERFQYVDLVLNQIKFDQELELFRKEEGKYNRKGIFLIPQGGFVLKVIFTYIKSLPIRVVFSVLIDYTNWNVEPPSIKIINQQTGQIYYSRKEVGIPFVQSKAKGILRINAQNQIDGMDLLQGIGKEPLFFCFPGVLEYHNHPNHSGDNWFLYRGQGEGELHTILHQLYIHSIPNIAGFDGKEWVLNVNSDVNRTQK